MSTLYLKIAKLKKMFRKISRHLASTFLLMEWSQE